MGAALSSDDGLSNRLSQEIVHNVSNQINNRNIGPRPEVKQPLPQMGISGSHHKNRPRPMPNALQSNLNSSNSTLPEIGMILIIFIEITG